MKTLHILAASAAALVAGACGYDTVADADYPAQRVYLAASAAGGVYTIESVPSPAGAAPDEGAPFRFRVDAAADAFLVPLAVYRAGIDDAGDVTAQIAFDRDTVLSLIAAGLLPGVEPLPEPVCSMPAEVRIGDGRSSAGFDVRVRLSHLVAQAPAARLAFGVQITGSTREVNASLGTVVVVIDTKIMVPAARFTYRADAAEWNRIHFTNASENCVAAHWRFGDGTTSDENDPVHVYEKQGVYPVELTTRGVTGEEKSFAMDVPVLHIEKIDKARWSIAAFSTEEPAENNGNGLAAAAIDDRIDTYWHSQWSGATPGYPHFLTVDMGAVYTVANVQCVRRQGDDRGQTECRILLSLDGSEWTDCGTFAAADTDAAQTYTMPRFKQARYIRYEATKGRSHFAFLAEISAYGSKQE